MEEGMPVAQAALEAARLRFRPIVMTSMAFVLGIVPLVFATGAGAAARRSMGTGVFGGMILATFVATIFIPLFFTWLSAKHVRQHGHLEGLPEKNAR
jgi:multidrug efflux pump